MGKAEVGEEKAESKFATILLLLFVVWRTKITTEIERRGEKERVSTVGLGALLEFATTVPQNFKTRTDDGLGQANSRRLLHQIVID